MKLTRKNKFFAVMVAMLLLVSLIAAVPASAAGNYLAGSHQGLIAANSLEQALKVKVDNRMLSFDVQPVIEKGRTLVPFRALFEALGALVKWDGETRAVTAVKGDTAVKLTIGSNIAVVNQKEIVLDVPAKIINGRTIIPLRFASEALGAKVKWDATARLVSIVTGLGNCLSINTNR